MLPARAMRVTLLALAVVLIGCPSPDTPASGEGDPFSDVYKSKQTSGAQTADAVDPPEATDPSPEAASATAPRLVAVNRRATVQDPQDTFLHLRNGPSAQSTSLERMPNGASLVIEACQEGTVGRRWCRVTFEEREGWAFEGGLQLVDRPASPREAAPPRSATISDPDGWTNLRTSGSTSADVITRLISGAQVKVQTCVPPQSGSRSRWCEVEAFTVSEGTLMGWVAESRLRYN